MTDPIVRTAAIVMIKAGTFLEKKTVIDGKIVPGFVMKENSVLLGKIKIGDEKDMWMFPWYEFQTGNSYYKNFFTGLWNDLHFPCLNLNMIDREKPYAASDDIFPHEHYQTLFLRALYEIGNVGNQNKERYQLFNWVPWQSVEKAVNHPSEIDAQKDPYPLSPSVEYLVKQHYNPFHNVK